MEAEKPIGVYRTSRKKIVLESVVFFCVITLQGFAQAFNLINLGGLFYLLILVSIILIGVLVSDLYKYSIIEIYNDRVTIRRPVFKKVQTVKYEDFKKLQFGTGKSIKVSGLPSQSWKFLFGHYQDRVRKTMLAEFAIDYTLFENYEKMVIQIWMRIHCKKLIDNEPAENDDIYKALKMKPHELTTSL